jgi:hypothetical protein
VNVKRIFLLLALSLLPIGALGQQNDLSLTFGGAFTVSPKGIATCEAILVCPPSPTNLDISPAFAVGASFSHRFVDLKAASLGLELPFMAVPVRTGPGLFGSDFSTIYFTPSLQAKFAPSAAVSPFVSAGAGLAHFSGRGSDTSWAFQFGGGLDFKTRLPHLGFRIEARDFVNGRPNIGALSSVTAGHMQQVFAGGGIVFRF